MLDPYIDRKDVASLLGFEESTAGNVIGKINQEIKAEGYWTRKGKIPFSEFRKRYKISDEEANRFLKKKEKDTRIN